MPGKPSSRRLRQEVPKFRDKLAQMEFQASWGYSRRLCQKTSERGGIKKRGKQRREVTEGGRGRIRKEEEEKKEGRCVEKWYNDL